MYKVYPDYKLKKQAKCTDEYMCFINSKCRCASDITR